MAEAFQSQLDFIFLVYGFSFVVMGAIAGSLALRGRREAPWACLAIFGLVHGAGEWLDMLVISQGDSPTYKTVRLAVMATSYVALVELGRQGLTQRRSIAATLAWHLPLLALAGLGGFAGLSGLQASSRYALGLSGALMTATVFFRLARFEKGSTRSAIALMASVFVVYAVAAGAIVPEASFWPARVLNHSHFFAWTGIPIQLIRAASALLSGLVMWRLNRASESDAAGLTGCFRRLFLPVATLSVIAIGWWVTESHGRDVDSEMRESVLRQAIAIERTIDPDLMRALSFTEADKEHPCFVSLRRQMVAFSQAIHQRSIYSMKLRDGKIYFGPESLPEGDALASPPGTLYEEPSRLVWNLFKTGKPATEGPYTDEYGTFVSAMAPVVEPRTEKVLAVIGVDVPAADWSRQIGAARLGPMLSTISIALMLLAGSQLLKWRSIAATDNRRRLQYVEAGLTASAGLVLTVAFSLGARDAEKRQYRQNFLHMADGQVKALRSAAELVRMQLEALERECDEPDSPTEHQFRNHAAPLLDDSAVVAYEWAPVVPHDELASFDTRITQALGQAFRTHGRSAGNERCSPPDTALHFPVTYAEPAEFNGALRGFDLASDPARFAAAMEALTSGLPTASDPIKLIQDENGEPSVLICQPVSQSPGKGPATRPAEARDNKGVVMAVVRLAALLRASLVRSDVEPSALEIDLYRLADGARPELVNWLCDAPRREHEESLNLLAQWRSGLSFTFPLFLFGKPYAVLLHPSEEFIAAHPCQTGFGVLITGLVLTVCVTLALGILSSRRMALEDEVVARGIALRTREESYRRQFAENKAMMLIIDPTSGAIIDANESAARFYGYPLETLRSISVSELNTIEADILADLLASVVANRGGEFEFTHRRADGSTCEVEVYASVISHGDREVVHSIVQDITDRKRAERQLADYHHSLERLVEDRTQSLLETQVRLGQQEKLASVGQLAAGIAHEINTPMQYVGDNLRAIQDNFNDLLELERQHRELVELIKSGGSAQEKAAEIEEAAQELDLEYLLEDTPKAIQQGLEGVSRVSSIVRAMKEFSHQGKGSASLVDLNRALQSTLTVARNEYKYVADVETDLGDIPQVECFGAEMNQVFLNMVVNAAHAIADTREHGKITVRTRQVGERVEIAISDTGTGIPESAQRKIFDPFFTTKEVGKGTGQGLYISHQVVVGKHNGELAFETEQGKGTTFFIRIPIAFCPGPGEAASPGLIETPSAAQAPAAS